MRDTLQTKVLVADDHAMVREGMAEMLSLNEDIEIVGQAGDGREAVELAKETKPDVVILDVEMPVMGAQAALRRLLELSPPPNVVIVTVFANQRLVRELLELGASAFLTKNASSQDLAATVRSVTQVSPGDRITSPLPCPEKTSTRRSPRRASSPRESCRSFAWRPAAWATRRWQTLSTSRRRPSSATCPTSTASSTSTAGARP